MKVVAVSISDHRGIVKTPQDSITLKTGWGIEGDAHAGKWHRQVSLLAEESMNKAKAILPSIDAGNFAENILTQGIELYTLPIGTVLQVGEVKLQVTQIGKECHQGCAIRQQIGDCVMPREGIFAIVLNDGVVKPGDEIENLGVQEMAETYA